MTLRLEGFISNIFATEPREYMHIYKIKRIHIIKSDSDLTIHSQGSGH